MILRDSSTWTIPIRQSDNITVKNVKLLGYRANSDGIDICNSRDVTVENCFIRTLDDLIVIKSDKNQGKVKHIVTKGCVLWNQVAHALSVGAELSEDMEDVLFTVGIDDGHAVEDTLFQDVILNGRKLDCGMVQTNAFVKNLTIE